MIERDDRSGNDGPSHFGADTFLRAVVEGSKMKLLRLELLDEMVYSVVQRRSRDVD